VSYSIVRTCARCGTRAEHEIRTTVGLATFVTAVMYAFEHPNADDGCPNCCPELVTNAAACGLDLESWRAAVARARSRQPV
jgi:hypothetical protein